MTCGNCRWRVLETENGDYSHFHNTDESCFCLVKDFFTQAEKDDPACIDFQDDNGKDEK